VRVHRRGDAVAAAAARAETAAVHAVPAAVAAVASPRQKEISLRRER
jgi:hypothetical protein